MKIIAANKLTDCRWLNLFEIIYTGKSDAHRSWWTASRSAEPKCVADRFERPDAVIIVPFHIGENKLVITREYRVPLGDYEYGFPAGLIDEGETVPAAAVRELREETGLGVTRILKTGPPVYSSAGMTDESVVIIYVECDGTASNTGNQDSEIIEVALVSRVDAGHLCERTDIKFDAKAWLVVSKFAECGRL